MKKKKVGIVILNWNNFDDTKECLRAIQKQTYTSYEVVIVDGNSSDHSTEKIEKLFPKFRYIYLKKDNGYSGGNNAGIRYFLKKKFNYVLSMNNDVILDKNALSELIKEISSNNTVGIVGPRMYSYTDRKLFQISGGYVNIFKSKPMPRWIYESKKNKNDKPFSVVKLPGACLLVRAEAIRKVGLMNDNFFLYYADTDWEKRISDNGWSQYSVPTAKAYHKISATTGRGSNKILYYDSRDFLYYVSEHYSTVLVIYSFIKTFISKNLLILTSGNQNKVEKLKFLNKAYFDFVRGKQGKGI